MKRKTLLSWSSGKDCAWSLYKLQQDPAIEVVGLFCTVNQEFKRAAMHAVRIELLEQQALSIGLPLQIIEIPNKCSNEQYEKIMGEFVRQAESKGIDSFAFGDIFLEDVKNYRIEKLKNSKMSAIFPIWGKSSEILSKEIVEGGVKAIITCLDPTKMPKDFIGKEYTEEFLEKIPREIDPCGENGEFHSFVFDGPMFKNPINISKGRTVERDGYCFTDLYINP